MPTWQIIIWALIAVLFFYAVWQIVQAVHIGSRAKDAQRIARRNDTRRAASLNTPAADADADTPAPPAKRKNKAAKSRKENRLDFSAYLPPEDDPLLNAPPAAAEDEDAAPSASARRSFDEDLQAQIDLLSTYDQISSQFDGAEAPATPSAPHLDADAAPEDNLDDLDEDDDPQTELALDLPPVQPHLPMTDPTVPREADELVLFSGDGAPPTTLWSRSVPIPHAEFTPESSSGPATGHDGFATVETFAAPEASAPEAEAEAASAPSAAEASSDAFPLELELRQFRRELAQMRGTMAEQRQQNVRLSEALDDQRTLNNELHREISELREQIQSMLTGQSISPEYSEPLMLAQRGMGVDELAEHCGISVAEAQLVCSLAASRRTAEQPGEAHEPQ